MKWSNSKKDHPLLALTTSSGELHIYLLNESRLIQKTSSIEINEEKKPVVLSLDWNDRKNNNEIENSLKISTSDSSGTISVIDVNRMEIIESLKNHDFEAWITIFDAWNDNVIYSGGDDCKLFMSDLRIGNKIRVSIFFYSYLPYKRAWRNKRA